jgi:hypothetical protein
LGGPSGSPHRMGLNEQTRHQHAREQHPQDRKEEDLEEDSPALGPPTTPLQVLVRASAPRFPPVR